MRIGYNRDTQAHSYGAMIMAAGLSSRMGEFKPLLYVDGRTALAGLVESLRGAGVEDILVVSGHEREKLQPAIREMRLEEAYNERFEDGMFSSIRSGLAKATELWPEKEGYLLIPVDCPLISIDTIRSVIKAGQDLRMSEKDPAGNTDCPGFVVPTYEGKKGHPLLIPCEAVGEILSSDDEGGLKSVTDRYRRSMIRVPVNDEGCIMDMDTPEGYEEIRKFVSAGFRREKLSVITSRRRIFMVRHGETEEHEGPMFIGCYDVPLSEEGCRQGQEVGRKIAELITEDVEKSAGWVEGVSIGNEPMPPIENIYCSDLERASKTAEYIAEEIWQRHGRAGYAPKTVSLEDLREVDLGDWDGRLIEEIKEEYPEEYEERGQDIFVFKIGNRSENFYDMQYRTMKALRYILANDDGRNIVIVAHSGVIRAIENNLKGLRVDDPWEPVEKGGIRIWEAPPLK